jgi:gamma-glutamyltranspeptidase
MGGHMRLLGALLGVAGLAWGCAPARSPAELPVPAQQTAGDATADATWPAWPAQNRPDVSGMRGAVVADHPLAVAAGFEALRRGGNAVDAAVTMAAVLAVVRPHMNGVGGDAFALFHDAATGQVTALNGSGRAGALATPGFFTSRGMNSVPASGAASVTVPGAVSAWAAALERHGTITLAQALQPAIELAEHGWVVTATLQRDIGSAVRGLNPGGRAIFAPDGAFPPTGGVLHNRPLAATLRVIAQGGADAFYRGAIGQALARFIEEEGGHLRADDFRAHQAEWVEPLSLPVDGRRIYAMPPNSQGFVQLQQIALSAHFPLATMGHNSADYLHTLIEAKKLSFDDRDRWLADPSFATIPIDRMLHRDYLRDRAGRIGHNAVPAYGPGIGEAVRTAPAEGSGDTVYLMAIDAQGNAVSWIQSLFASFGSRLVEPQTGIVLQNRGSGFVLDDGHPNIVAPGKRPFHTLTPALVTDESGRLIMTMGTPGGHGQPQFLTQVYHAILTFGMSPQQAVEAPRFISNAGRRVSIENRVAPEVVAALRQRGHEVTMADGWTATFGGVQIILRDPLTGALRAGADPRREGYAIAY